MRGTNLTFIAALLAFAAPQAHAKAVMDFADPGGGAPAAAMPGVLQCVPFARNVSGIRLYGDAHTWWQQAEGKYARGQTPRPGAVMAISPHGNSTLGHVATVSRVIDARTILISHANWSAPGKIERNVTAMDVSPGNDWSEVRVWYAPIQNLGGAHWPVSGFIYNASPGAKLPTAKFASSALAGAKSSSPKLVSVKLERSKSGTKPSDSGRAKALAGSTLTRFVPSKTVHVRFGNEPLFTGRAPVRISPARVAYTHAPAIRPTPVYAPRTTSVRAVPNRIAKAPSRNDPIGAILASAR